LTITSELFAFSLFSLLLLFSFRSKVVEAERPGV
jgi:hypothetical protein